MSVYEEGFGTLGLHTAQVLLTEDDFVDPVRFGNLSAALGRLFELGCVPILNENDVVSTTELETRGAAGGRRRLFGDNDRLSALVMSHVKADVLVILSDVDGLYTSDPARDARARLIPCVAGVTPEVAQYAHGPGARGRGGMETKLEAARLATESGGLAVIANGKTPHVLDRIFAGEGIGTVFLPAFRRGP
jgi:glutamate 5-kinase